MGDLSGEYTGCASTGMFSAYRNCVQILVTLQNSCIIMLQHEVVVEWHDSGPQAVVEAFQCIQIAINKMHLCS